MSSGSSRGDGEKDARQDLQLDGAIPGSANGNRTSTIETKQAQRTQDQVESTGSNSTRIASNKPLAQKQQTTSWFAIPKPLKQVFDKFPLREYGENQLPGRARQRRVGNLLYIWTSEESALQGQPSFNPSCLKWQTFLKISGVPFNTLASNNHASPSGSLPFLLSHSEDGKMPGLVPSNRLKRWIKEKVAEPVQEPANVRHEVYTSLLENCIRKAWLYQLYLHPVNEAVVRRLYVIPSSSNPLVQWTVLSQLRSAAESEIIKASTTSGSTSRVDEVEIMRDADDAFKALSTLLGDASWFFSGNPQQQEPRSSSRNEPSLFDASVFAYTHLILDGSDRSDDRIMKWTDNSLRSILERYQNLVQHRERMLDLYY